MEGILLTLCGLGWTLDLVLFVLDLNYWLMSTLISFLVWTICFAFSLPVTITLGLQHCWECMLLVLAKFEEFCCNLVLGTVQATGGVLEGFLVGLDRLHLVWNLLCHLVIKSKDTIQHSLRKITLSGQNLHQQVSEVLTVASSLAAYIVNTLVDVSLIVMQTFFSAVLYLWLSLLNVIFASKELIVMLFSQLSSTVVAMAILVWTPFQMAVDVLLFCSTATGILLFKYLYEIILLLFLMWVFRFVLMPSSAVRFFCEKLNRVYHIVLILLRLMLNSNGWRRLADRGFQLLRMYRAAWDRDLNQRRTTTQNTPLRMAAAQNFVAPTQNHNILAERQQNASGLSSLHENSSAISVSQCSTSTSRKNKFREDPWKLLKQQEESRKCVICQDQTKTVLLLPCRHLCLCSRCTQILLQQPVLQRNCPLCRQMILQTLNVYM